ncbi:hypothetical protein niasHT_030751 [Heterodera trifolii]|uniref:Wbp11/ELF5/Saf1 N-terminal domain-containing protein n=1 Tax=Heterodera trifolii TaxID=157864 RepID=A0ABD2HUR8_9BILA
MGKRSGVTKSGRVMNPADRERKQQRAKELKRNKKQRTMVRHAIVKGKNPEEIIELMSRLDDQEFDPQRELSLNVIQEKRHKLRGSFFQVVNLYKQEKDDKRVKNLEKMLVEYEVERAKKEENFRAQLFSENANFEEIPLPLGAPGAMDAAKTPFSLPLPTGIAPGDVPSGVQLQAAMRAGILKKTGATAPSQKRHKHPPGPPPGLPPPLAVAASSDSDGEDAASERRRVVRFTGDERMQQKRRREKDGDAEGDDGEEAAEEEDYAPVEIPDSMLSGDTMPPPQHQPVYARAAPPVMLPPSSQMPSMGAGGVGRAPLPPGMAPPPPGYPPGYYASNVPPEVHAQAMRTGRMPPPPNSSSSIAAQHQQQQSKTGLISYTHAEPHPSAVISAAPQVVKPSVTIASSTPQAAAAAEQAIISAGPQMRNIRREATRFVPTAVKIQRPLVHAPTVSATGIGPRVPTMGSTTAGRLMPQKVLAKKQQPKRTKTTDEACDEFLRELEGLL